MSLNAYRFAETLDYREDITPQARLVLYRLAGHANDEGYCELKTETLAEALGISRRHVQRATRLLKQLDILVKEKRNRRGGSQACNGYRIPIMTQSEYKEWRKKRHGCHPKNDTGVTPVVQKTTPVSSPLISNIESVNINQNSAASGKTQNTEILEKTKSGKKLTLEEIREQARARYKKGTLTPTWLWLQMFRSVYDEPCTLTVKEKSKLKAVYKAHKGNAVGALRLALSNWINFTVEAEKRSGAFNSPLRPEVWYFVKHFKVALFLAEKAFKAEKAQQQPHKQPQPKTATILPTEPQQKTSNAKQLKETYGL